MNARRSASAALAAALVTSVVAACGGSSSGASSSGSSSAGTANLKGQTITYWASNQGPSLEADKKILTPELAKFTAQTGAKVNLEVVGWPDLLNRILAATTSGKGPDVLNIGNTWSASLQATGALMPWTDQAMQAVGGKDRFLPGSFAATGAPGKPPTALPIYSLAYALYDNKKQFAAAGIDKAPTTWDEFVADGKKLTRGGKWGLALEAGNPTENAHHAFTFAQQYGGDLFSSSGQPQFDQQGVVDGVKRYIDFMGTDKIVNPSNAENSGNQSITDFATGKAAMLLWQAAGSGIKSHGMSTSEYGVAPVPFQMPAPAGGKHVSSMVAGINLAVFQNTAHKDAAMAFTKFHDQRRRADRPPQDLRLAARGQGRLLRPGLPDPHLEDHLAAAAQAARERVPLAGYFAWSLLDNLEWAYGYDKRFGLVRVDYETQERTVKTSGKRYAALVAEHAASDRTRSPPAVTVCRWWGLARGPR